MRISFRLFLLIVVVSLGSINASVAQWNQTGQMSNGVFSYAANALVIARAATGDTNLIAGTNGGLFISNNDGVSWSPKYYPGGVVPGVINTFALSDTNIFAGTINGMYLSTNAAGSWKLIDSGLTQPNIIALAASGTSIFAGILPSTKYIATPPYVISIPGGVYLSTNNGTTWGIVDTGLVDTLGMNVSCFAVMGTTIFAGTSDGGGIYRSTNNGATWTSASTGLLDTSPSASYYYYIYALAVSGTTLFAGTDNGVFVSTNNGTSWTAASTGLQANGIYPYPEISSLAVSGSSVFAGANGGTPSGVYMSTNNGTSWTMPDTGMTNYNIHYTQLLVWGNRLYALTESGVWYRPLNQFGTTSVNDASNALPARFSLSQNYPNPFNPTTVVSYQLPVTSRVTLKVYDVLGREVASLVDAEKNAGIHSVTFDGNSLSSGVYFYRLQAGNFSDIKKLMLVK